MILKCVCRIHAHMHQRHDLATFIRKELTFKWVFYLCRDCRNRPRHVCEGVHRCIVRCKEWFARQKEIYIKYSLRWNACCSMFTFWLFFQVLLKRWLKKYVIYQKCHMQKLSDIFWPLYLALVDWKSGFCCCTAASVGPSGNSVIWGSVDGLYLLLSSPWVVAKYCLGDFSYSEVTTCAMSLWGVWASFDQPVLLPILFKRVKRRAAAERKTLLVFCHHSFVWRAYENTLLTSRIFLNLGLFWFSFSQAVKTPNVQS